LPLELINLFHVFPPEQCGPPLSPDSGVYHLRGGSFFNRHYAHFCTGTDTKEQLSIDAVRKVASSFDFAALFVRHGLIKEAMFLKYWGLFLLFLKEHLSDALNEPSFSGATGRQYYRHLEWLMNRAATKESSWRSM
jgi:hypothetical protein